MRGKRESLEVIHDILEAVQKKNGRIKPTHIMYKANLSHQMLKEYLKELMDRGFLEEEQEKRGVTYSLTQKGFDYVREFSTIKKFMTSFGLDEGQD